MAFIVSLIEDAMIKDLTDALQVDGVDRATVVRRGPLHEDPQKRVTTCVIFENDPDDPSAWFHEQTRVIEIGGEETYKRRFKVKASLYLTKQGLSRDEAKELIDVVQGRCIHALRDSTRIVGITDEFGEWSWMCKNGVEKSRCVLRGGPPSSWIGEIEIWFTVWTQLP